MSRQARLDASGSLQHVIVRGIEKGRIFLNGSDRAKLLIRLEALLCEYKFRCYAWALLSNKKKVHQNQVGSLSDKNSKHEIRP